MSFKKAIIFDFDGVIVETESKGFKLIQKVIKNDYAIDIDSNLLHAKLGKPTRTFLKEQCSGRLSESQIENAYKKVKAIASKDLLVYLTPHTKIIQFIKDNADIYDFAIATMNTKEYVNQVLNHFEIKDKLKAVVTRDEVGRHKPDPEVYEKAIIKLDCQKKDAVVVEDTPIGVNAANNAKIDCIVVLNGLNKRTDFKGLNVLKFVKVDRYTLN